MGRPMKPKELVERLRGQISRSYLFQFLDVYEKEGMIVRVNGTIILAKRGFLDRMFSSLAWWAKWRKEHEEHKREETLTKLDIQREILFQEANMTQEEYEEYLVDPEKKRELAKKCREVVEAKRPRYTES